MAFVSADRVRETSTTTGTGTYSLAGAASGFRTFVAGVGNGNKCHYLATDGTDWELGLGTVTDATPDTLARTRVLKSSNADAAVSWGAGSKTISCVPIAAAIRDVVTPRGHRFGLLISNNGTDANNDIDIATGEAMDESGEVLMVLTSPLTKRLDAAWAVGTDQGGLNTGAEAANTWYEVMLIYRQDTGVVDVMFTTAANRDTLPAGYTHKRHLAWIRNNASSNILAFTQDAQETAYFTLTTPINDIGVNFTTTATAATLTAPPNCIARIRATNTSNASVNTAFACLIQETRETAVAPDDTVGANSLGVQDIIGCNGGHMELQVDANSQIRYDMEGTTGTPTMDIQTYGWIDRYTRQN